MFIENEKEFYAKTGAKFRKLREEKEINQIVAAKKAGIAPGDLSKFENNGKKLSAYRIIRLLIAINCTPSDLYDDEQKKTLSPLRFQVEV